MKRSPEGSIFLGDDRRWRARLQFTDKNGRRQQKVRICKTRSLAIAKLQSLKAELENDAAERKTFRQLDSYFRDKYVHEARFVGNRKLSGFRQDTDTVKRYLDRALEFFGDRAIDSITYGDLERYKLAVANRPVGKLGRQRSMSDINHHLKRLRRLFAVAVEQEWLAVNPFKKGGSLIIEAFEVERTRILSTDEESRLLAACDRWRTHLKPIIVFGIETACRRGEIQSLQWSSVNLEGRVVRVESHSTKTLKSRLVPISARLRETLAQLWHNSPKRQSAHVFGGSDFKTAFNAACAEAKLSDVHFHDLRHTAITRMLEKGISPPLVMKISGHTQQKTFLRYVNQSESSVYEIAMKLDRAA